jgi:predicted alpha/beta-hydrolase family hydrolase
MIAVPSQVEDETLCHETSRAGRATSLLIQKMGAEVSGVAQTMKYPKQKPARPARAKPAGARAAIPARQPAKIKSSRSDKKR